MLARAIVRRLWRVRLRVIREPALIGNRVWLIFTSIELNDRFTPLPSISLSPMIGRPETMWNISQVTLSPAICCKSLMTTIGMSGVVWMRSRFATAIRCVDFLPVIMRAKTLSFSISLWSETENSFTVSALSVPITVSPAMS